MNWRREALEMWRAERRLLRNGTPLPKDWKTATEAIERLNKELEDENS